MAPQLQGRYWVSSWPRLPYTAAWPCSAHAQRRRVLRLTPPRRPYAGVVCVVADAGPALVLEPVSRPEFPSMEDVGRLVGHKEEAEEDLNERERLRRLRISKANKGNTPWNKGRKHSQETLQRIRERTRIAMQDPKVKKKLMNLGHAQSEETRIKISEGVRRGWSLRLQKLMVQDGCFVEWRDMIADAARKGFAGGVSLQWCSYKILTEEMRQEWLGNLLKKRSMPRPRGNRRAPKTPEQRRKIAEAIAAKWLDQEYRERVCSGIASYHGTSTGTRTPRSPRPTGEPGVKRHTIKKKPTNARTMVLEDAHGKAAVVKRKKSAIPYKDPMAGEKLKMITKIRAQRAGLETEKKEAIRRARSLIAEAEKAVTALETVVSTSPCAQASLIEARKLVTEARTSLECVDVGHAESACAPDDILEDSAILNFHNNGLDNQNQRNVMEQQNKHINWKKLAPSNVNGIDIHLDTSSLSQTEKLCHRIECSMERAFLLPSASSTIKDSGDFQMSQSVVNDDNLTKSTGDCSLSALEEEASSTAKKSEKTECCPFVKLDQVGTPSTAVKSLRWVRGRLVEVYNETGYSET